MPVELGHYVGFWQSPDGLLYFAIGLLCWLCCAELQKAKLCNKSFSGQLSVSWPFGKKCYLLVPRYVSLVSSRRCLVLVLSVWPGLDSSLSVYFIIPVATQRWIALSIIVHSLFCPPDRWQRALLTDSGSRAEWSPESMVQLSERQSPFSEEGSTGGGRGHLSIIYFLSWAPSCPSENQALPSFCYSGTRYKPSSQHTLSISCFVCLQGPSRARSYVVDTHLGLEGQVH